jgi:hypothetical protein
VLQTEDWGGNVIDASMEKERCAFFPNRESSTVANGHEK